MDPENTVKSQDTPAIDPIAPDSAPPKSDPDFMMSLARGLSVIRAFDVGERPLSIAEVSRLTKLSRAAARRCLHTLQVLGYVANRNGLYELTPTVLILGHAYLGSIALPRIAQPVLDRVSETLHESSSVAVLDGDEIVYVARAATRRILSIGLAVGSRLPADCTSMGRVLLAYADDNTRRQFSARVKFVKHTPHTITDRDGLRVEFDRIRSQGYALVCQELEMSLSALAVPIRRHDGTVVAAMNVGFAAPGPTRDVLDTKFLPVLEAAASEIGKSIRNI